MADTDDEQTVALEPDQREQGEDDSAEAAGERRGAGKWVRERPAAVLTPEEQAARREEEELLEEEEIELAARDERELAEIRHRREVRAAAETSEAIRLAEVAEAAADRHRTLADRQSLRARSDWAHGHHLLDEAAARPDEPDADATAAAGRRYQRAAVGEDRKAAENDRIAKEYDAEARDRRGEARQEQPPAAEAVRNPPTEAPSARSKFVRQRSRRVKRQQRKSEPGALKDIGLGD
jgi:hypothetical protein